MLYTTEDVAAAVRVLALDLRLSIVSDGAGLKVGDRIAAIDGQRLTIYGRRVSGSQLNGPAGTSVKVGRCGGLAVRSCWRLP